MEAENGSSTLPACSKKKKKKKKKKKIFKCIQGEARVEEYRPWKPDAGGRNSAP